METATKTGNGARLTHITFYKACEALRTHRERFLKECPGSRKAAEMLSALAGFSISESSIQEIKEASGVTWERKRRPSRIDRKDAGAIRRHADRTIARAVRLLYRKFDEEMPSSLATLCDFFDGKIDVIPELNGHSED